MVPLLWTYIASDGAVCKIGRTRNLQNRLKTLGREYCEVNYLIVKGEQIKPQYFFQIVSVIPGDHEFRLHTLFGDARISRRKEWFWFTSKIQQFVKENPPPRKKVEIEPAVSSWIQEWEKFPNG